MSDDSLFVPFQSVIAHERKEKSYVFRKGFAEYS